MSAKKGPGRPKKVLTPEETDIELVRKELAKETSRANQNHEYARQVGIEVEQLRQSVNAEKQRLKEVIDTVSYVVDTFENTIRMMRKAIERDLTSQPKERERTE